jgi:hypothetical protein
MTTRTRSHDETKARNPIKGSCCDPKGATVGVGTGRGRAGLALGSKPKKGVGRGGVRR